MIGARRRYRITSVYTKPECGCAGGNDDGARMN